ncbi:MAG: ATP-binding protein, partial [Thermodesulfobacteriota bacterium]|nr:ATP-binding protein [Thermodesulfobacteriota bacterium]
NRRRRAEEELDLERRQLLSIFDSIDEPVYVSDPETYELLYVNEAFKKHWGDGTGQKCHQVVQHTDSPCSYCTNDLIFGENTGRAYIWEARNGSANRWFRCFDKAIRWPDCRMVRYEMAIDITEQKRAGEAKEKLEARLQRAERMEAIGILAGGVAHDLNNILSGIVSYPDLLLMKLPKDSELREPVLTIQRSGQKAADVVQDLLTLARRGVTITEVVNLNNIITGYLSSPEHERLKAFHPTVEFDADLETDLLNNVGSPVHLSKAVMNLAANAAEALAEGGKVIMSTRNLYIDRPINGYDEVKEGDYVALSVKDNGIGISADDLERIFEPFYSSKVMGRSGTGLGTAVVWGTVKDHNGYIDIESEEGKGTTFTFYLPATREEIATEKSISSFGDYMGKGESVLVVDDIEEQREIASGILTSLGYSVSSVSSGEEAVDYVMNNSVDLLVLDMVMDNGIDGLETYKRIIELHPGQKAVIVSGFSESDRVREAQGLGAGPYVKKPYVLEKIGLAVRSELDNH